MTFAGAECFLTGQVCSSLTRIVVPRDRHDEFVDALGGRVLGGAGGRPVRRRPPRWGRSPWTVSATGSSATSPRASSKGATLVTGGGRPKHLERGYYIEPTVFADVDNKHASRRRRSSGRCSSVIPADDEQHAVEIANDTIYGLNAAVFTPDAARAREVAGRLRSGTVGHNGFRIDFGIAFGGFKQSGIGREGGREGLLPYLETKTILLDETPD